MATLVACGADTSGSEAAASANVEVRPQSAFTVPSGSVAFAATVTGAALTTVTWSIQEAGCGSISSTGLYTAPSSGATCHVVATLASYGVTSAPATVNVGSTALCANEPMRTSGTVYYYCDCQAGADPTCVPGNNTTGNGTAAAPWQSGWKDKFRTMAAGQTVALCRGGAFATDTSSVRNANCRANNTCDLRDYTPAAHPEWANDQTKRPIISGSRIGYFGGTTALQGFRFFNLQSVNGDPQGAFMGGNTSDVDICNVSVSRAQMAVFLDPASPRWTVRQSQFANITYREAIFNGCDDCVIDGNYFANTSYGPNDMLNHPIYLSSDHSGTPVNRMRVTNNEVHACPPGTTAGSVALVAHGVFKDLLIENNLIQCDNPFSGGGQWGIQLDHGGYPTTIPIGFYNVVVRRNRIIGHSGNGIALSQSPNALIEDNLVVLPPGTVSSMAGIVTGENSGRAGTADPLSTNSTVRNNTVVIQANSAPTGVRIKEGDTHNVTNTAVHYTAGGNGACFTFPLPQASYAVLSNNACNGPWGTAFDVNRLLLTATSFTNSSGGDYSPALGSTLLNAGTTATSCTVGGVAGQPCYSPTAIGTTSWTLDDAGKTRDGQPDVGAFER